MSSPVLFVTTWINHPETVAIQKQLIEKFCAEKPSFLAIIDAKETADFSNFGDASMRQQLIDECKKQDIIAFPVPPELHQGEARSKLFPFPTNHTVLSSFLEGDPSARNAVACQFAWNIVLKYLTHYKYVVFLQSDIFPFAPFSVVKRLEGRTLEFKSQIRFSQDKSQQIEYAWDGFLMFDLEAMLAMSEPFSFEYGPQAHGISTDTGGGSWKFVKALAPGQAVRISSKDSLQWTWETGENQILLVPDCIRDFILSDPRNIGDQIYTEIKSGAFIHLRGGGNWEYMNNPGEALAIQSIRYSAFMEACQELLK